MILDDKLRDFIILILFIGCLSILMLLKPYEVLPGEKGIILKPAIYMKNRMDTTRSG